MVLTVDLRRDLLAKVVVEARDADSAVKLKRLADDEILAARKALGSAPGREGEPQAALAEAALRQLTVTCDGPRVTAVFKGPEVFARIPQVLTPTLRAARARRGRVLRHIEAAGQVGMVVVYEVDADKAPPGVKLPAAKMRTLRAALERRLNPAGRPSGRLRQLDDGRIEVSIFRADPGVMQRIADLLPRPGTLQFRILANQRDHPKLIARAKAEHGSTALRDEAGKLLAWWVPVRAGEAKSVGGDKAIATRHVARGGRQVLEVLVVSDGFNVTGASLQQAVSATDFGEWPCVAFTLDEDGTRRFRSLTEGMLPDPIDGFRRRLGTIIDGELWSGPGIMGPVYRAAVITGEFRPEQAQDLADLLNAGALPTAIRKVEQRVVDAQKQPLP